MGISLKNGLFWTTGGGFDPRTNVQRPNYQDEVVSTYLNEYNTAPASFFNPNGRGYVFVDEKDVLVFVLFFFFFLLRRPSFCIFHS